MELYTNLLVIIILVVVLRTAWCTYQSFLIVGEALDTIIEMLNDKK